MLVRPIDGEKLMLEIKRFKVVNWEFFANLVSDQPTLPHEAQLCCGYVMFRGKMRVAVPGYDPRTVDSTWLYFPNDGEWMSADGNRFSEKFCTTVK